MNKAVFFDKDGTLIPNIPYNINPEMIFLYSDACLGLKALFNASFQIFIVSNQSGIAKGFFSEIALKDVEKKMEELLFAQGVKMQGFYFCPHDPKGIVSKYSKSCNCRKPEPGMLLQAAKEHKIDLSSSWMIGDILSDIEAGNRAGCKSILINNGNETLWQEGIDSKPDFIANSINHAAHFILSNQ
jgi:D,D-heptose 1,7-bisphosphate phosphatase